MKRKMIAVSTAYLSGLFFASFFTKASDLITVAGISALLILIGRKKGVTDFSAVFLSFVLAFSAFTVYTGSVYRKTVDYSGTSGSFSGTVSEIKDYGNDKSSYILKGRINGVQRAKVIVFTGTLDAEYGDMIEFDCKFSVPESDYLFDSESYYKSCGIFLTADSAENTVLTKRHKFRLKNTLMEYRERIISDFKIKLGNDCGSFLAGMVFGEKSDIDGNIKDSLYRSGIGHILAVSGLHVSVMAWAVMVLLKRINKYVSFAVMDIVIIFMIFMAKSPVSAIRAGIMLNMVYSARLFRRENDTFNSLAVAVLIICIFNPYVVYSSGFVMSVSGTFGIGVFAPYMTRNIEGKPVLKNFLSLVYTTAVIMPVSMLYFDEISLVSPVMNVIFVPLCSVAMIIGMIYVFTGSILPILKIAGVLLKAVIFCTEKAGSIKWTYFPCGDSIAVKTAFICAVGVMLVKVFSDKRKYIVLSLAVSLCAVLTVSSVYADMRYNRLNIAVLGRGNNSVSIITYRGNTVIADLNGNYKTQRYAEKYLKRNGIDKVDIFIVTDKIQSKYPIYRKYVRKWLVSGSTPLCGEENAVYGIENGFVLNTGELTVNYSDGVLSVLCGSSSVNFTETAESYDGLTIHCGNLKKNDSIICDGRNIYTDSKDDVIYKYSGMNNFEISDSRIKKLR